MAQDQVQHPKLLKLQEILSNHFQSEGSKSKVIIFCSLRDSVHQIVKNLSNLPNVSAKAFIGQGNSGKDRNSDGNDVQVPSGIKKEKGMSQQEQKMVLEGFRSGQFNVMVATCIAEEGLDIPQVDLIVCYDASASPTRNIQRMGRTGRKKDGHVAYIIHCGRELDRYEKNVLNTKNVQSLLQDFEKQFKLYDRNPRMLPREFNPMPLKTQLDPIPENLLCSVDRKTRRRELREKMQAQNEREKQKMKEINNLANQKRNALPKRSKYNQSKAQDLQHNQDIQEQNHEDTCIVVDDINIQKQKPNIICNKMICRKDMTGNDSLNKENVQKHLKFNFIDHNNIDSNDQQSDVYIRQISIPQILQKNSSISQSTQKQNKEDQIKVGSQHIADQNKMCHVQKESGMQCSVTCKQRIGIANQDIQQKSPKVNYRNKNLEENQNLDIQDNKIQGHVKQLEKNQVMDQKILINESAEIEKQNQLVLSPQVRKAMDDNQEQNKVFQKSKSLKLDKQVKSTAQFKYYFQQQNQEPIRFFVQRNQEDHPQPIQDHMLKIQDSLSAKYCRKRTLKQESQNLVQAYTQLLDQMKDRCIEQSKHLQVSTTPTKSTVNTINNNNSPRFNHNQIDDGTKNVYIQLGQQGSQTILQPDQLKNKYQELENKYQKLVQQQDKQKQYKERSLHNRKEAIDGLVQVHQQPNQNISKLLKAQEKYLRKQILKLADSKSPSLKFTQSQDVPLISRKRKLQRALAIQRVTQSTKIQNQDQCIKIVNTKSQKPYVLPVVQEHTCNFTNDIAKKRLRQRDPLPQHKSNFNNNKLGINSQREFNCVIGNQSTATIKQDNHFSIDKSRNSNTPNFEIQEINSPSIIEVSSAANSTLNGAENDVESLDNYGRKNFGSQKQFTQNKIRIIGSPNYHQVPQIENKLLHRSPSRTPQSLKGKVVLNYDNCQDQKIELPRKTEVLGRKDQESTEIESHLEYNQINTQNKIQQLDFANQENTQDICRDSSKEPSGQLQQQKNDFPKETKPQESLDLLKTPPKQVSIAPLQFQHNNNQQEIFCNTNQQQRWCKQTPDSLAQSNHINVQNKPKIAETPTQKPVDNQNAGEVGLQIQDCYSTIQQKTVGNTLYTPKRDLKQHQNTNYQPLIQNQNQIFQQTQQKSSFPLEEQSKSTPQCNEGICAQSNDLNDLDDDWMNSNFDTITNQATQMQQQQGLQQQQDGKQQHEFLNTPQEKQNNTFQQMSHTRPEIQEEMEDNAQLYVNDVQNKHIEPRDGNKITNVNTNQDQELILYTPQNQSNHAFQGNRRGLCLYSDSKDTKQYLNNQSSTYSKNNETSLNLQQFNNTDITNKSNIGQDNGKVMQLTSDGKNSLGHLQNTPDKQKDCFYQKLHRRGQYLLSNSTAGNTHQKNNKPGNLTPINNQFQDQISNLELTQVKEQGEQQIGKDHKAKKRLIKHDINHKQMVNQTVIVDNLDPLADISNTQRQRSAQSQKYNAQIQFKPNNGVKRKIKSKLHKVSKARANQQRSKVIDDMALVSNESSYESEQGSDGSDLKDFITQGDNSEGVSPEAMMAIYNKFNRTPNSESTQQQFYNVLKKFRRENAKQEIRQELNYDSIKQNRNNNCLYEDLLENNAYNIQTTQAPQKRKKVDALHLQKNKNVDIQNIDLNTATQSEQYYSSSTSEFDSSFIDDEDTNTTLLSDITNINTQERNGNKFNSNRAQAISKQSIQKFNEQKKINKIQNNALSINDLSPLPTRKQRQVILQQTQLEDFELMNNHHKEIVDISKQQKGTNKKHVKKKQFQINEQSSQEEEVPNFDISIF